MKNPAAQPAVDLPEKAQRKGHGRQAENVAEVHGLSGRDGEDGRAVRDDHGEDGEPDLEVERELVGERRDDEDGGGEGESVGHQEDVEGEPVRGVDGSAGGVAVLGVLPDAAGRVDPSLERHCGDQRRHDQQHVAGVAWRVFLFVVLEALEPFPP